MGCFKLAAISNSQWLPYCFISQKSSSQIPDDTEILSDWKAVERDENIPWDLEETPLQIKTPSKLGSTIYLKLKKNNNDTSWISNVILRFSSPVQYKIDRCIGDLTDLPVQPLMEVETIWTIVKTETALIIICNDAEVLNYRFADSSNSKCVKVLGGDVVNVISFIHYDSASNFYRAGKGLKVLHRWCSKPYHSSWFK
jgi:hypothetical protein